jgi:hypothetical protein
MDLVRIFATSVWTTTHVLQPQFTVLFVSVNILVGNDYVLKIVPNHHSSSAIKFCFYLNCKSFKAVSNDTICF